MRWIKRLAVAVVVLAVLAGVALAYAPTLFAEALLLGVGPQLPGPAPGFAPLPGRAAGRVVDGYWRVQKIAPATYAIGEPANAPDNYEYLLIGATRALLIDSGSTARDMHPALAGLTDLPLTVFPTHLHSDHTNGLRNFHFIALADFPATRADVRGGLVHLTRFQYMGPSPIAFRVNEWVKPGSTLDLGGREINVLATPGHTATSVSFYDPAAKLLFAGDFIYPTTLYAFGPESSLSAYAATMNRLLALLPADARIYGGHCCRNDAPPEAPWLAVQDLRDVQQAVRGIRAGTAHGRGLLLRRFPVNRRMTLLTFYPFGNH